MLYAIISQDVEHSLEKRKSVRPAHIERSNLFPLRDRQKHRLKNAPSGQNYYAPQGE
jgi:uncharacterized protein YciI